MQTLAANLKRHRKARRLTRLDVEAGTGIPADVLRRYENEPGMDAYLLPIVRLARFFQTTIEDLLTDPDPNIPAPPPLVPRPRPPKP